MIKFIFQYILGDTRNYNESLDCHIPPENKNIFNKNKISSHNDNRAKNKIALRSGLSQEESSAVSSTSSANSKRMVDNISTETSTSSSVSLTKNTFKRQLVKEVAKLPAVDTTKNSSVENSPVSTFKF